jgi:molecular chaperone GrpE (heat shock protein)
MGSASSTSRDAAELTSASENEIRDDLLRQLAEVRADAHHYEQILGATLAEVEHLRAAREHDFLLACATASVAAATAAVAGGFIATSMVRRRYAAMLAQAAQDLVDLRRRSAAELQKVERYGSEKLLRSLLPGLDAVDSLCEAGGGDAQGAELTRSALVQALRVNGIEKVEAHVGDKFDPQAGMEAMLTVPSDNPGYVESILRPGYALHERVVRAAQVGVGVKEED